MSRRIAKKRALVALRVNTLQLSRDPGFTHRWLRWSCGRRRGESRSVTGYVLLSGFVLVGAIPLLSSSVSISLMMSPIKRSASGSVVSCCRSRYRVSCATRSRGSFSKSLIGVSPRRNDAGQRQLVAQGKLERFYRNHRGAVPIPWPFLIGTKARPNHQGASVRSSCTWCG